MTKLCNAIVESYRELCSGVSHCQRSEQSSCWNCLSNTKVESQRELCTSISFCQRSVQSSCRNCLRNTKVESQRELCSGTSLGQKSVQSLPRACSVRDSKADYGRLFWGSTCSGWRRGLGRKPSTTMAQSYLAQTLSC